MGKYSSTKVIPLGSCAFRQPYATSHCRFIHGYRLQAKFWFSCNQLDKNNWVVDFGGLKNLKTQLEETFDHKTVVWSKDPDLDMFKKLEERKMIELVIFDGGVGIEKFAEFCYDVANEYVDTLTGGRCWCTKVEVWEHEDNSACYEPVLSALTF
jgi:6-pyruvoyltetrahydropterin/6-carboxytetrahydropterin synthase